MSKYKVHKNLISCDAPLFKVPPPDVAMKYTKSTYPSKEVVKLTENQRKESAFMVCSMITSLNEAAVYYKDNHCDNLNFSFDNYFMLFEDFKPD